MAVQRHAGDSLPAADLFSPMISGISTEISAILLVEPIYKSITIDKLNVIKVVIYKNIVIL
jgi:hypothetical protein